MYDDPMKSFFSKSLKPSLGFLKKIRVSILLSAFVFRNSPQAISTFLGWIRADFKSPAPQIVKWSVLSRWGGKGCWVETGTFLGDTTLYLSKLAKLVKSIEPSQKLAADAVSRLKSLGNVEIICDLSENVLDELVAELISTGEKDFSFWLDGHFSEGITFQGPVDTPIRTELNIIGKHLQNIELVTVFIDDVRCFNPGRHEFRTYPDLKYLVNWATSNQLYWVIEHDIFIATNRNIQQHS
jgi:hypothetical protein